MIESQAATAGGALTGAAISTTSLLMGAQVDALVVGLVAAVFVSIQLDKIDNRIKAASAVLLASLLAGYGSPVAAGWLSAAIPSVSGNADALRMLLAVVIGGGAPTAVPLAINYLARKGESL